MYEGENDNRGRKNGGHPDMVVPVQRPAQGEAPTTYAYDVFVAQNGAVFEYGADVRTRVRGKPTFCERAAFAQHATVHGHDPKSHAVVCGVRVWLW